MTRNVVGVEDPLDAQERLANIISSGISPPLMPAIEIVPWRDKAVIFVEVFPVDGRILAAIGSSSGLRTKQIAEITSLSPRSARTRLKALVEKGLIVEVGSSPTDPKRVYLSSETKGRSREIGQE